jgi:integrase
MRAQTLRPRRARSGRWRERPLSEGKKIVVTKLALGQDEIGPLLRWLPNVSRLLKNVLTIYLWTGARGAEICQMRGDEVMIEANGRSWMGN